MRDLPANLCERNQGIERDSTLHDEVSGQIQEDVGGQEGSAHKYFVISGPESGTWYFRCDDDTVADQWVEKLQPLLHEEKTG